MANSPQLKNRSMAKYKTITVKGTEITIYQGEQSDFISLTDIAKHKDLANTDSIIQNWLRNRNTIELLGFWESMYNPNFKPLEFEGFRKQAGLNSFVMTPKKWIESTNAMGIISKSGRYGGTKIDRFAVNDQIIKLSNESNKLIPEATNRKPGLLIVVEPADTAKVGVQAAGPGGCSTELRRTPPVAVVANVVECSIVVTVAARQACH